MKIKVIKKPNYVAFGTYYQAHPEELQFFEDRAVTDFRAFEAIAVIYLKKLTNPRIRSVFDEVIQNLQDHLQENN